MEKLKHILFIFDYISALPICIYASLVYTSVIQKDIYSFLFFIQLLVVDVFLVPFLKHLPYPNFIYNITRRPVGATNCDYLSKMPSTLNAPGLPSGHMTVTTMFSVAKMLENKSTNSIILHSCIVVLMALARYYKKCHNIVQIIAGTILGTILGYISFHLYNN